MTERDRVGAAAHPGRDVLLVAALLAVAGARAWALDPARYLPPPGAPYQAEEVRVRSTGTVSLGGTFTMPRDGRRRHPAVVLVGDVEAEDRNGSVGAETFRPFYDLADTLGRRGFAVLRLDDRGVGASNGSIDSMTTFDRSLDTRAALAFLRARPDVLTSKLGIVGIGEGASIAALLAADDPGLAGVVLLGAPNATGRERAAARRRGAGDSGVRDSSREAADPWARYDIDYDPLETARRVRVPVLLLQGAEDAEVPAVGAASLAAAFRASASDVTLRVFPGLDHSLRLPGTDSLQAPEVRGAIADWIARHLAAGPERPEPRKVVRPARHRKPARRGRRH